MRVAKLKPWYQEDWFIILSLIFAPVIGIIFMWLWSEWSNVVKAVLTALGIVPLIIMFFTFIYMLSYSIKQSDSETTSKRDVVAQSTAPVIKEAKKTESVAKEVGIKGGQYKVGIDIPAGEYVVLGTGYLEISSDSTGSFQSIIENDNYSNRTIFVVYEGQYVEFDGRAYKWDEVPKLDISSGVLGEGKYKVGTDFPAGEYKIVPSGSGYYGLSSSASEGVSAIISNDNFDTERYLTVLDGQYLKISRATLKLK